MDNLSIRTFMNRIMPPMLRSPLHFLVSSWCLLITVRGRRTGKLYTTPVYYQREGSVIRFFSGSDITWIKNIREGATVTLRLRGQEVLGNASACEESAAREHWLKRMYPRMSAEEAGKLTLFEVRI